MLVHCFYAKIVRCNKFFIHASPLCYPCYSIVMELPNSQNSRTIGRIQIHSTCSVTFWLLLLKKDDCITYKRYFIWSFGILMIGLYFRIFQSYPLSKMHPIYLSIHTCHMSCTSCGFSLNIKITQNTLGFSKPILYHRVP